MPRERAAIAEIVRQLYRCFVAVRRDALRDQPARRDADGELRALDAKVTIDDSALYRHPELAALATRQRADTLEGFAARAGRDLRQARRHRSASSATAPGSRCRPSTSSSSPAGAPANFCDLGGGGSAAGVVAALEVIARDPQVRVDPLQHLRRHHALRRGRARHPGRARPARASRVPIVVRLDGTNADEGRRILAEAGAAEPRRRADDARRRPARGGARGMSDAWSERAELYRTSRCTARAPTSSSDRRVGRGSADGARCRDRGRARRPAAARGRARGRQLPIRPPGWSRTSSASPRSFRSPTRASTSSLPTGARTTSRCPRRALGEMARVSRDARRRSKTPSSSASAVEEAEQLRDPSHVAQLQRGASGASSSTSAASSVEEVARFDLPIELRVVARAHRLRRGRWRRACASCSPTAVGRDRLDATPTRSLEARKRR